MYLTIYEQKSHTRNPPLMQFIKKINIILFLLTSHTARIPSPTSSIYIFK